MHARGYRYDGRKDEISKKITIEQEKDELNVAIEALEQLRSVGNTKQLHFVAS